jgi:hypothetical protein
MTHTPGPWVRGRRWGGDRHIVRTSNGILVADAAGPSNLKRETMEANARLIAAAPELLAALKEWTSIAVNSGLEGCDEILEQAEAAIVKAEEVQV